MVLSFGCVRKYWLDTHTIAASLPNKFLPLRSDSCLAKPRWVARATIQYNHYALSTIHFQVTPCKVLLTKLHITKMQLTKVFGYPPFCHTISHQVYLIYKLINLFYYTNITDHSVSGLLCRYSSTELTRHPLYKKHTAVSTLYTKPNLDTHASKCSLDLKRYLSFQHLQKELAEEQHGREGVKLCSVSDSTV